MASAVISGRLGPCPCAPTKCQHWRLEVSSVGTPDSLPPPRANPSSTFGIGIWGRGFNVEEMKEVNVGGTTPRIVSCPHRCDLWLKCLTKDADNCVLEVWTEGGPRTQYTLPGMDPLSRECPGCARHIQLRVTRHDTSKYCYMACLWAPTGQASGVLKYILDALILGVLQLETNRISVGNGTRPFHKYALRKTNKDSRNHPVGQVARASYPSQ